MCGRQDNRLPATYAARFSIGHRPEAQGFLFQKGEVEFDPSHGPWSCESFCFMARMD